METNNLTELVLMEYRIANELFPNKAHGIIYDFENAYFAKHQDEYIQAIEKSNLVEYERKRHNTLLRYLGIKSAKGDEK